MGLEQVVTEPKHFTSHSETLIDVVCTDARVRDVSVTNITGKLGHSMINVTFAIKRMKIPPRVFTYRPIKNIDLQDFNRDLASVNFESISKLSSVESMVSTFNSVVLALFDRHAPLKTVKIGNKQTLPWVTDTIKHMIDLRNAAHDQYRQSNTDSNKQYYSDLKTLVIKSIYQEKRAYFNHYINIFSNDSKSLWKNLKQKVLPDNQKHDCLQVTLMTLVL